MSSITIKICSFGRDRSSLVLDTPNIWLHVLYLFRLEADSFAFSRSVREGRGKITTTHFRFPFRLIPVESLSHVHFEMYLHNGAICGGREQDEAKHGISRKGKRKWVVVIFSRYSCTLFKNDSALRKEIRMTILTTLETLFTRRRGCVLAPVRRWR